MDGYAVDEKLTRPRHPSLCPFAGQPDGVTHPQPTLGREQTMILGQGELFAVCQGQAIDGLGSLVDDIGDVACLELAGFFIQDTDAHSPDASLGVAKAVGTRQACPHASATDSKFSCDRPLTSTLRS